MVIIRSAHIFSKLYTHLIVIMASKANEGPGGSTGGRKMCATVIMMNELQF